VDTRDTGEDRGRTIPGPPAEASGMDEISLVDILGPVYRGRVLIAAFIVIGLVGGTLLAFLTPKTYTAQAKILPTTFLASPDASSMAQLRGAATQLGLNLATSPTNASPLFPNLLTSRDLLARILAREYPLRDGTSSSLFKYMKLTGGDPDRELEIGAAALRQRLRSTFDVKSGITTVSGTFRDPRMAAAVTNAATEELGRFLQDLKAAQAGLKAQFIDQRLVEVQAQLEQAENALKTFRDRNRQIIGSPQLMLEEARLGRNVTMYEQVFITLKTQLEIARIDAVRNVPDIAVVEKAVPPLYRVKWRRTAMGAAMLCGLAGILIAYSREQLDAWRRMVKSLARE
jgi:tyrosine-protein kinase Etk/Wzc